MEIAGRQQFAARLQADAEAVQSLVTSNWSVSESEAVLQVEKVFTDRNEKWRMRLQRSGGNWAIVQQAQVEEFAPEIPFGTQVVPETN